MSPLPRVLTVAGSDSGGGAGIQADLKTMLALGAHGMSVLTAVTAQNSLGVQGLWEVPKEIVRQQFHSVVDDIGVQAVKTGMLASAELVETVAGLLAGAGAPTVVDPVGVSKHGDPLLATSALDAVRTRLLPVATVVTPNLHEVEQLTGVRVTDESQMRSAADALLGYGPRWVLVKGGHLPPESFGPGRDPHPESFGPGRDPHPESFGPGRAPHPEPFGPEQDPHPEPFGPEKDSHQESFGPKKDAHPRSAAVGRVPRAKSAEPAFPPGPRLTRAGEGSLGDAVDLLTDGDEEHWLRAPRWDNRHTHGTGCTLASAIAVGLAKGSSVPEAVAAAKAYVTGAIVGGFALGAGIGPVDHGWEIRTGGGGAGGTRATDVDGQRSRPGP